MTNSPITYTLTALLCAVLLFSCTTPEIEPIPELDEQNSSSSDTEQPPLPPNRPSSSSTALAQSSSSQQQPTSSPTQSSSSAAPKSSSSSLVQITSNGCKENNPISGFTCAWDRTGILTPGTTIKPSGTPPSGCTVAWKFAPDNTAMALNNACEVLTSEGLTAEGSRNYVLFAELDCAGTKHTNACTPTEGLSSKRAPELTGACKWDKNPTTTARGATPSGVAVSDPDKICTSPTVVYKYDGGTKTWPTSGIVEAGTYSDVEATLNCPAYNQPVTVSCPPLEVNAGAEHIIECDCDNGNSCDLSPTFCKTDGVKGNEVTLKNDECVEISVFYTNQYLTGNKVVMRCSTGMDAQQNLKGTLLLNGNEIQSFTGSYNWSGTIEIGKINLGANEFGTLCLTNLIGATGVKCTGPSY